MKYFGIIICCIIICSSGFSQQITLNEGGFWEKERCDACETCGSAFGDRIVEVKEISAFCDGKDIGEWSITHVTICPSRRGTSTDYKEYYRVHPGGGRFNSEYKAIDFVRAKANNLCFGKQKQEGYTSKDEARAKRQKEREEKKKRREKLITDYQNGLIIPDTSIYRSSIPASTLSRSEILDYDWELIESAAFGIIVQRKKIQFNPDGSFIEEIFEALSTPAKHKGTWEWMSDNSIQITHEARIGDVTERIIVYKEKYSFWEGRGRFVASSSRKNDLHYEAKRVRRLGSGNFFNDLNGTWNLKAITRTRREPMNLVVDFKVQGNEVKGKLKSAKQGNGSRCQKANFQGVIKDGIIDIEMEYLGECCPGLKLQIKGELFRENQFFAEFTLIDQSSVRCREMLKGARVTGIRKGSQIMVLDSEKDKKSKAIMGNSKNKSSVARAFNNTFENLEGWSISGGKAKIKDEVLAFQPAKKKKALQLTSDPFRINGRARYMRFDIDHSRLKGGEIKLFIIDSKTGEKEEVYTKKKKISLRDINNTLETIGEKNPEPVLRRSERIDMTKYRNKTIRVELSYLAKGISKPIVYLDNISIR